MLAEETQEITTEGRRERLDFLGIGSEDVDNLRALQPVFSGMGAEFAERFYEHLLAHPHTVSFLKDPETVERLKKIQEGHFASLLEGVFDEAYFDGRLRVGRTHQKVGLEPNWYLGAYNQYIQITFPLFVAALGDLERALPLLLSLVKVIFLDIDLALHAYAQTRTEELRRHNEELRQALRLYWQSQRREGQLRRLLSHEVRGGLAAVITSLEDLKDVADSSLGPAGQEDLEGVTRRCWALSDLLREMLAPPESTGPCWVDTQSLFQALGPRLSNYAEGRDVRIHFPANALRVWADPIQLREVFANLISNAARYMDHEPGRVDIFAREGEDECLFVIADDGPGIPEEVRRRLFEPFVRGGGGRKGGTGLGLYFVRSIVEQGGGHVWVESEPGCGTRVSFTVPKKPPRDRGEFGPFERPPDMSKTC
jgi:signal transduction histidine kinase